MQAELAPAVVTSLSAGEPVAAAVGNTIADGIAVERPGQLPFAMIQQYVDDVVTVNEDEVQQAIRALLQRAKLVAEGAGAAALAVLMGQPEKLHGGRTVLVLSGGNIDLERLAAVAADPA